VIEAVIDRTIHFGVDIDSDAPPRLHPDLVRVPMFRDVVGVVCARGKPPLGASLFHVPRVRSSERVVEALRAKGRLPERVVPCGDLDLVESLVLSGAGIGVLPWRVAIQGTARCGCSTRSFPSRSTWGAYSFEATCIEPARRCCFATN
jgi:DNA-binding transcriptional LysR family regulator